MAVRQVVTVGPLAAASANNIALSQTPTSGTPVALNGSTVSGGVATLDKQRRVLVTFGSESSGRTIQFTGANAAGQTVQETVAIPASAAGSVFTQTDFLTITKALPGGGGFTAAVTIGTNGTASSPWQGVTEFITPVNVSANCVVSGAVIYTVETTNDSIDAPLPTSTVGAPYGPLGAIMGVPTPFVLNPNLQGQAANASGMLNGNPPQPIRAWRLVLNSGTGSVTATGIQGGIIQGH